MGRLVIFMPFGTSIADMQPLDQTKSQFLTSGEDLVSAILQDLSTEKQTIVNEHAPLHFTSKVLGADREAEVPTKILAQVWELVTVCGLTIAGSIMLFLYIFVNPLANKGDVVPAKFEMLDSQPEYQSKVDSQMKLRTSRLPESSMLSDEAEGECICAVERCNNQQN